MENFLKKIGLKTITNNYQSFSKGKERKIISIKNKNFDSKVEDTIVGKLSIREIELDTPFSITAYLEDDKIFISGFTEIDTTWFGFDAPTRFNAWEVFNPIGIKVELVAKRS